MAVFKDPQRGDRFEGVTVTIVKIRWDYLVFESLAWEHSFICYTKDFLPLEEGKRYEARFTISGFSQSNLDSSRDCYEVTRLSFKELGKNRGKKVEKVSASSKRTEEDKSEVPISVEISEELVFFIRDRLGEEGINFFKAVSERYEGDLSPVLSPEDQVDLLGLDLKLAEAVPHPVHFREGVWIRNQMRSSGFCDNWSIHDLDNKWSEVVRRAIDC